MRPLLSIVIPTKNRYEYLKDCILTLIKMRRGATDVEIVVQDNSDDNSIFLLFVEQNSSEFCYFYERGALSVTDNCDRAILHATGEYVCFIGDDDSVTDRIVDVVKWMKRNDIEACLGRVARFNWPDLVFGYHKFPSLSIPPCKKNKIKDVRNELKKVLNMGGCSMYNLPRVYHGIVAKVALDRVYRRTGSFFPGPSPDMANAVALCVYIKCCYLLNIPIIVSGFSYKSTGGQGTRHAHVGKIEDMMFLPKETVQEWENANPKYWTGETIYAESVIKALKHCGEYEKANQFNYYALYATFLAHHWHLRGYLNDLLRGWERWYVLLKSLQILARRGKNFFLNTMESRLRLSFQYIKFGVTSLDEAVTTVNMYNRNHELSQADLAGLKGLSGEECKVV